MFKLRNYLTKRQSRRNNVRISSTQNFNHECHLKLEQFSRLGEIVVDQSNQAAETLKVGA